MIGLKGFYKSMEKAWEVKNANQSSLQAPSVTQQKQEKYPCFSIADFFDIKSINYCTVQDF